MGRSVELSEVVPEIERFGALATLITVGEHDEPHVGSVLVEVGDERLVVRVGPTTAANMSHRPAVSLSWLPSAGGDYQLIVDGVAESGRCAGRRRPDPGPGRGPQGHPPPAGGPHRRRSDLPAPPQRRRPHLTATSC